MASEDAGQTVEQVVLKLETNFEKVLTRELGNFSNFVTKSGNITRSVSKSFNELGQSVAKSIRTMIGSASKEVVESYQQTRNLMGQVASQGIEVNKLYLSTFNELEVAQEGFRNELEETLKQIQELQSSKFSDSKFGEIQKSVDPEAKKELENKARELSEKFKLEKERILDTFNLGLGKMAQEATGAYVKTTETALLSVRKSVDGIVNEFKKFKTNLNLQDDMSKMFAYQTHFDKVKKQHANLQESLRQQTKLTADAENKMKLAQYAFTESVDEQVKAKTKENWRQAAKDQSIVREGLKEINDELLKSEANIKSVQNEIDVFSQKMTKVVSADTKSTSQNVFRNIKKSMDLLVEKAEATGGRMHDALVKNIEKSTTVSAALEEHVQKLKELREQALLLHKTGFVDERSQIRKIDAVLKKYEEFVKKYKHEQAVIESTLGKTSALKSTVSTIDLGKVRNEYNNLSKEIEKNGAITSKNMFEAQDSVKKLESLWKDYVSKRISLHSKIRSLEQEQKRVTEESAKVTNVKLKSLLDDYINKIKTKIDGLKGELNKPFESQAKIRQYFDQIKTAALSSQNEIKNKYVNNNKYVEESFNGIKKQYDALIDKATKLSQKRFVSKHTIDETKKGFEDLKVAAQQYAKNILLIQNSIRELQQIQKRGLGGPGIQQQIKTLQENAATMKSHIQSLNVFATQAQRNIEKLHTGYVKTIAKNAWESIRNFRWQVAAIIYLFTYAARAIQRAFFDVIEQAQEFRKQAMSIASNVVYKMVGEIESNYQKAYEFSRNLMVKLELEAARTILTLEDMLMLTKTFAQAGIIPKTNEDVRRISTIGTAIKALTEGMANAGVQMRQELYAIIAGRQRSVDQLAMMFKMMGVNIQEVIDKSKKEGKSMIEALSEALEPFEQMNKMMEKEFETVKNKLITVWGIIKRIAAEPVLEKIAAELNSLIDKFIDMDKMVLTPMGENFVQGVRAGLVVIHEWGKYFLKNLQNMFGIFTTFLSIIHDVGAGIGLWKNELNNIDSEALQGVLKASKMMLYTFAFVYRSIDDTLTVVNTLIKTVTLGIRSMDNLGKATSAYLFRDKKALEEIGKDQAEIWTQTKDAYKKFWDLITNKNDPLEEVDAIIKGISDAVNNIDSKPVNLGFTFELPDNFEDIKKTMESVFEDHKQMRLDAAEGPVKFELQYQFDLEKYAETKEGLKKAIDYIDHVFMAAEEGFVRIPAKQRKMYEEMREGFKENLQMITDMEDTALKRRDKDIADHINKEKAAYAEALKQYNSYLIELSDKPETPTEKVDRWYALAIEEINKLIETNQIAKENIQKTWDTLAEGYQSRVKQNIKDAASEYDGFINKIKSHEAVNAIDKIGNEFNDVIKSIKESLKLENEEKIILEQLAIKAKDRRIELEKTAQAQRMIMQQFELEGKRASFMQKDFMPDDTKKSGKILEVENQYNRSIKAIEHEIINLHNEWQKEPGIWGNNLEEFKKHSNSLSQELKMLKEEFKFDSFMVKLPFDSKEIERSIENLRTKTAQITKESLTGPAKFEYEYEEEIKELNKQAEEYKKQIKAIRDQILDVPDPNFYSSEQRANFQKMISELEVGLGLIADANKVAFDRMNADIKKHEDEQKKALARQKKEWESYLIEIANKPETRKQKTDKWYELQIEKIKELEATNEHAAKEIQRAWDALAEGFQDRLKQDVEDTAKEYQDFVDKVKSYETINAIDKIQIEFNEIYDSIKRSVDLNDTQKFQLAELAYLAKERRIELEKTAQAQRMTMRQLDLEAKKAAFLQKDWMPDSDKRIGKILELRNNYVKSIKEIEHEIINLHNLWQKEPGIWNNNTQEFQQHAAALKQEMQMLKEAFKYDDFVVNLPYSLEEIEKDIESATNKAEQYKKDSLTGPAKIKYEYKLELADTKEERERIKAELEKAQQMFSDATTSPNFYPPEQRAKIKKDIDSFIEGLKRTDEADAASLAKKTANLNKWAQEQSEILASQKKEWETWLIGVRDRPQTRDQKTLTWLEEEELAFEKHKVKFKLNQKEIQRGQDALFEGFKRRMVQNAEATEKEVDDLINTLSSHEILDPIEKINLEFEKIQKTIKDNINFQDLLVNDPRISEGERQQRQALKDKIELLGKAVAKAKEERIEIEKTNLAYRNLSKALDVQSAKASYLQGSYSPAKQLEGDIMALETNYIKAMADIRKEMERTFNESYDKINKMWTSEEAKEYFRLLQEEAKITDKVFQREFFDKQFPLWAELTEMSKNWADGLSDSLADLVLDFDNFGESIKSLWESILRDTLKASIKQGLINPLMSALGTGEPGSPTPYQKIFGKKDQDNTTSNVASAIQKVGDITGANKNGVSVIDQMLNAGKPIPVYIVASADQVTNGIQEAVNRTNDAVNKTGSDTKGAINSSTQQSKNIFQQMLSALFGIKAAIIGSSTSNAAGSAAGSAGGIFGMLGSLFGGGAGGGAAAGATTLSTGAVINSSGAVWGMAEGGTISEHIVGRGLKSGRIYEFGEKTKYGEFEDVIPRKKMPMQGSGQSVTMSMPININAIDTQTGVDFIMRNQKVIENGMLRSMKNNKALRGVIRQSW